MAGALLSSVRGAGASRQLPPAAGRGANPGGGAGAAIQAYPMEFVRALALHPARNWG